MDILDGAIIEYEADNPELSKDINDDNEIVEGDLNDKILVLRICQFLGISDLNYNDSEVLNRISQIIKITGKDNALNVIQSKANELGFKPGVLDDIYSNLRLTGYGDNNTI